MLTQIPSRTSLRPFAIKRHYPMAGARIGQDKLLDDILSSAWLDVGIHTSAAVIAGVAATQTKGAISVAAWIVAAASLLKAASLVVEEFEKRAPATPPPPETLEM